MYRIYVETNLVAILCMRMNDKATIIWDAQENEQIASLSAYTICISIYITIYMMHAYAYACAYALRMHMHLHNHMHVNDA